MIFTKFINLFIPLLFIFNITTSSAQKSEPSFLQYINHPWVDSIANSLTLEEKIAQSIWVAAYSNRDVKHEVELAEIIKQYHVGGFLFFQGTAEKQVEMINYFQSISKVPMTFTIDGEWGVGMRLTGVESFPYQMTLGAIRDDSLLYRMGTIVAEQCKSIGVQFNFAPVADINNNPLNPVINYRSFGENRENTAFKTAMYMKGMQDHGVLASAKHFPGHGDTDVDSHADLPVISHSKSRLDSLELYPFKHLVNEGIGAVMTAHLNLPSLDSTSGRPSTLSEIIINDLLINELGFNGLIVTDAMNMKGVTKYHKTGEAEALALLAGNDVVEFVTNVEATINETKNLINEGKLTIADIDKKCRKILAFKYWSGLSDFKPLNNNGITQQINNNDTKTLIRELYANALTVLNNTDNIIPVKNDSKVAVITINQQGTATFTPRLQSYQSIDNFVINTDDTAKVNTLLAKLTGYDVVIAGVFGLNQRPERNFNLTDNLISFLERLIPNNKTIVTWFGNPYSINKVKILQEAEGLILAYQDNEHVEDVAAQLIYGGITAKGTLPVTINEHYPYGFGLRTNGEIRLQYGYPEAVGISSRILEQKIDSLANLGLSLKAFPGCEVMIAKDGMVILQKCYGYHEYDGRVTVQEGDLYDLASVTKVSATLPCYMLLDSRRMFSVDDPLEKYIPFFKGSDKGSLLMKDILTHQAGLTPYINFWEDGVSNSGKLRKSIFRHESSEKYSIPVADNLYMKQKYKDVMLKEIKKSALTEHGKYVYSDLGFMVSPIAIENITGYDFYHFYKTNILNKIGADNIVFNPLGTYPPNSVIPTELDSSFRGQLLHGTVHDEGAAMMGGVAGHAGLFATANDLLKLMELYRRMGSYGGEQIIDTEVVKRYSTAQFPENENRRGLGFDKPLLNNHETPAAQAYPCKSVSSESFGHSGFTGTFVWVDPVIGISYVFLCNRVNPTRDNNLLSQLNIRTEMLQAVYDSHK